MLYLRIFYFISTVSASDYCFPTNFEQSALDEHFGVSRTYSMRTIKKDTRLTGMLYLRLFYHISAVSVSASDYCFPTNFEHSALDEHFGVSRTNSMRTIK